MRLHASANERAKVKVFMLRSYLGAGQQNIHVKTDIAQPNSLETAMMSPRPAP